LSENFPKTTKSYFQGKVAFPTLNLAFPALNLTRATDGVCNSSRILKTGTDAPVAKNLAKKIGEKPIQDDRK